MRRSVLAVLVVTPLALIGGALLAPAADAGPPSGPGWQCRTGSTAVTADLAGSGTVCGRYAGKTWQGRATITLTARRGTTTSGTLGFGPDHLPSLPETHVTNVPFTVRGGHPVTLTVSGSTPVDAADSGLSWSAFPYVSPGPGSGLSLQGRLSSPVVTRTSRPAEAVGGRTTGQRACREVAVATAHVKGKGTLCVRRVEGYLESSGTFSYTMPYDATVSTGLSIDGWTAAESDPLLKASPDKQTTVVLPVTRSSILSRDDTGRTFLTVAVAAADPNVVVESYPLALN